MAGTERGVTEPTPTFSACFGAAFLMLHPTRYAEVLSARMRAVDAKAYLVNTGWNGLGKRISIKDTRAIIDAILGGAVDSAESLELPVFGLCMPKALPSVDSRILDPRASHVSRDDWTAKATHMAKLFLSNFDKFTDTAIGRRLVSAGPVI